jgi:hypothetical protein
VEKSRGARGSRYFSRDRRDPVKNRRDPVKNHGMPWQIFHDAYSGTSIRNSKPHTYKYKIHDDLGRVLAIRLLVQVCYKDVTLCLAMFKHDALVLACYSRAVDTSGP